VSGSLFDTNVWIAVVFPTHPFHALAQEALARTSVARTRSHVQIHTTKLSALGIYIDHPKSLWRRGFYKSRCAHSHGWSSFATSSSYAS
jgi:hypothetical protein